MAHPKASFKEIVERHPITSLVLAASAAVVSTFGVVTYFHQEQTKLQELESAHRLATQTQENEKKISYLEGRLASIERKVGTNKASFLDITALLITPEAVRGLDKSFSYFTDINCYIAIPTTEPWAHQVTTELAVMSMMLGVDETTLSSEPTLAAIKLFTVHLWKGPGGFDVNTGNDHLPVLHLFPFVAVQSFDEAQLATLLGKVADQFVQDTQENQLKEVLGELEVSNDSAERAGQSPSSDSPTSPVSVELNALRLEATKFLENQFRSDFASFMLFSKLAAFQAFQQIFKDCSVRLVNADKKGNVLYCHFVITMIDSRTKLPIYWDRETFLVCGAKRTLVVETSAPSQDRRSQSAAWITSWLSSIRMPLD